MRGLRLYILIGVSILFVVNICTCVISMKRFEYNGRFIIATIDSIKTPTPGSTEKETTFLSYRYKKKSYHYKMEGSSFGYSTGRRIFIKISPNGNASDGIEWAADCSVPDSIKNVPVNGWNKEWMKKNFPDCFLIKSFPPSK